MIRLGDIQFLNSWPVTYALRNGTRHHFEVVSGTPAELNRKLLTGELDASAVSSAMYLRHLEEFVPVPDLCIRSDSGVHSVLVVSRQSLAALQGKRIGVTNQGATTPIFLRLLLNREKLRLHPEVTSLRFPQILQQYPAALLIGDEALEASQKEDGLLTWDLGEAWTSWTKLPAVFALWVIRRSLVEKDPEILTQLAQALHSSYEWGRTHSAQLIAQMRKIYPFEGTFLRIYLSALSYDLDARAWLGLKRFAREAEKIGELPVGTGRRLERAAVHPEPAWPAGRLVEGRTESTNSARTFTQ